MEKELYAGVGDKDLKIQKMKDLAFYSDSDPLVSAVVSRMGPDL